MPTVSKKQEKFMQAVANNPKFAKKVGVNQSIGQEFTKEKNMKKNYMYGGKVKKMNMGGRTGDMMYSRGYGVDKKGKRMPTELMTAPNMNKGGKVKKMVGGGKAAGTGAMMGGMADKAGARAMSPAMKKRMEMAMMKAGAGGAAGGMKMGGKIKRKKMTDESGQRKVKNMRMGGNTSRMNDLEELGRVDNEKGYTAKGKRNLAAEKRRVVKEIKNKKAGGKIKGYKAGGATMKAKGKKMMMGGKVKKMKMGGKVSSASKRADGIAQKGHTRGRMV